MGLKKVWTGATEGQAKMLGVLMVGGTAAFLAYQAWRAGKALTDGAKGVITEDLNPGSNKNLVYTGVNAVGGAVTGDQHFSLGGWLYEKMNPTEEF